MSYRMFCSVCVLFLFVGILFFSEGELTGLATMTVFEKELDLVIDTSQSFVVKQGDSLRLSSLSVEGEVVGSGSVEIELVNKNSGKKRVFVNSEAVLRQRNMQGIAAPLEVSPAYMLAEQPKKSVSTYNGMFFSCDEACSLVPVWEEEEYFLNVYVDHGTRVILKKIVYTS